ncbi:MAG TPA: beta-ketoacyl synthase N-terminal-like domain-containing protein [Tepidisphaeraceae bacterium]|nr:beta-ketoacyl synthase N-terminal-like domain-containing protein [Tepidisphaeraceae bacterium]
MPRDPIITGVGLSTALGNCREVTWREVCARGGVVETSSLPGVNAGDQARVAVLGCRVAREAVIDARWRDDEIRSAALIVGTSKGPVDFWLKARDERDSREVLTADAGSHFAFGLAETATAVASDLGIGGPRLTVSGACASGLIALIRGTMMIRSGEARRVIVVGCESSLHPMFAASFRRLGVIAAAGHGCRPFDRRRSGFVISEAAAAVCLEARDDGADVSRTWPTVERFAMGADACHLTAGDPDGLTLGRMLDRVIDGRPIDLIHAHGTGTIANDPIELAAIERVLPQFCDNPPSVYSHKGALGHSLGAAGLVSVAINCLCHRDGIVPPNVATRDPLATRNVSLRSDLHRRPIRRSAAIAAGFGGAIAAVTLISDPPCW